MLILSKPGAVFGVLLITAAKAFADGPNPADVAEAEKAFARDGLARGIKQSFLDHFAEDGVVFAPGPVNAKAFYNTYTEKGARLIWGPSFATIAASGDIGFTTGPWELKKPKPDETAVGFGEFLSVWKKLPDLGWKVIVDAGIDHTAQVAAGTTVQMIAPDNATVEVAGDNEQKAFSAAEQNFYEACKADTGAAIIAAASPDIRLLRANALPIMGKIAAQNFLTTRAHPARLSRTPAGGGMSAAGDLAYRYGSYADGAAENGCYLTLWKKDVNGTWQILIDLQKKAE